jgi:hypothetical protein
MRLRQPCAFRGNGNAAENCNERARYKPPAQRQTKPRAKGRHPTEL